MSTVHPDFLKVLPADITRVGLDGAALLALMRYTTAIDDGLDRITTYDGAVWWRASYNDIGASLGGLGRELIRRLVSKLESAGELLSFLPTDDADRTRAYRPADQSLHEIDTPATSHNTESTQGVSESCTGVSESCNPYVDSVLCTTSLKNLKEVTEDTEPHSLDAAPAAPAATTPPGKRAPAKAGAKRKRRTQIRDDYMPPKNVIAAIRAEFPTAADDDLSYQHRKFIDHWKKTGTPMADWDATWRNWMRTANERGELGRPNNGRPVNKIRAWAELAAQTRAQENAALTDGTPDPKELP